MITIKCSKCGSDNVHLQYIKKGMDIPTALLFFASVIGGLTIPLAIWIMYDSNRLKKYSVCLECGKVEKYKEKEKDKDSDNL